MHETGLQGFYELAELLPEPLLLVDAAGGLLAANRATCRLLDSSLTDLRGRKLAELTVQSAAQIEAYLRRCSRSRNFVPGPLNLRHSESAVRIEGARYRLAEADRGLSILLRLIQKEQAIHRFTTLETRLQELSVQMRERVRAEQRERDLRQWLQGILSSIGEAVICTDLRGHVTFMNRVAETLTGLPADEALERPLDEIIRSPADEAEPPIPVLTARPLASKALASKTLASKALGHIPESRLVSKTGTVHDVEQHAAPIRDSDGKIVGGVLVVRDIQARRNRERRTAAEHGVARILMTATSIDDAADELLDAIRSGYGAAAVGLWLPDDDGSRLVCQRVSSPRNDSCLDQFLAATRSTTLKKGEGLPGLVWQQCAPNWIGDVRDEDTSWRVAAAVECSFQTGMAFPILLGEAACGVVEIYFDRQIEIDQLWIDSMFVMGSDIGQFIGRLRADRDLRRADLRRKAILDSAIDCVITADAFGRILEFNPAAEETFGYRRAQVVGRCLAETVVPPSLREQHLAGFQRFLESGQGRILDRRLEVSARRADGTEFPCELTITCTQIENEGKIFTAFLRDISQRREGEEAQARLAAIVNSSDDSIIGKRPDGTIISWNAGAEQLYGYTAAEANGQHISFIVPPEYRQELEAINQQIIRGERIAHFQTKRQHKDGHLVDVSLSLSPVFDGLQNIIGISSIARDISLQLQAEENLRLAKVRAEEANALKSQFLAAVSHELRTPMNAIIGMTDLALGEELPLSVRDFLETSRESASHLLSLLNDLLDFSKIEAGKFRLGSSSFHLRQAIDRSVRSFALQSYDQGIDLTQFVHGDVPDNLVGDEQRVRQIITNLVSNALKFTERGEVNVRCRLEHRTTTHAVLRFTVADTGIGIAPTQQQQLFKPFSQLDASMSRRSTGTGLGLAISAELVRRMQGRIWVESEENAGAVFHFTARFELTNSITSAEVEEPVTLHGVTVLVLEDTAATATVVCEMLSAAGAQPFRLRDIDAALSRMPETAPTGGRYTVAVIDAALLAGGYELLEALAALKHGAARAVILTSPANGAIARAVQDSYRTSTVLEKPVFEADLVKAVRRAADGASPQPRSRHRQVRSIVPETPARRVLVAEDTPANQKLLAAILAKAGHEVELVSDGSLAVTAAKQQRFDIILMDLEMPNLDGIEATRRIREYERQTGAHTPIVALTAHAMRGFSDRCRSAGMDSYLTKPIDSQQLLEAIVQLSEVRGDSQAVSREITDSQGVVLDLQATLKRIGNDATILEMMAEGFWQDAPILLQRIQDGLASSQAQEVHLASHSLKSLSAGFDAHQAASLCQRIEELAADNNLGEIGSLPEKLTAEINRVSLALQNLLGKTDVCGRVLDDA